MTIVQARITSFRTAFAVSALALATAFGPVGASPARAAVDDLLAEARQYREEGRVSESIIQLKNALQKEPANAEAQALLGGIYMDLGDTARAEVQLARARDLGAPAEEWLKPLLMAWLATGRNREVVQSAADLPEAVPARVRADALALAGRAHLAMNEEPQARAAFDQSIALAPDSALGHIGIGRLAFRDGDLAAAQAAADAALKADPEEADAIYLAGDIAMRRGEPQKALAVYQSLKDRYPFNPFVRIPLVQAQIETGNLDGAESDLRWVMERVQGLPVAHYLKGLVSYRRGDLAAADRELAEGLALQPGNVETQMVAGLVKYGLGQDEQAVRLLQSFAARPETPREVRLALGASLLRLNRVQEAHEVLGQVAASDGDSPEVVALLGDAARQAGDLEEAARLLGRATELAPSDTRFLGQLAMVRNDLGQTDEALDLLRKAFEANPDDDRARGVYFALLLRTARLDDAMAFAEAFKARKPDAAAGYTMEGLVRVARRDVEGAETSFREALKRNPAAADAAGNLSSLLILADRHQEARDVLMGVHLRTPNDYEMLMRLARLSTDGGDTADARQWLEKAQQAKPEEVEPRVRLAALLIEDGRHEPALALVLPMLSKHPRDARVLRAVALARAGAGDMRNAVAALQTLVDVEPVEGNYRLLADAAIRMGDRVLLQRSLEQLVKLAPQDPLPMVQLAELYMQDRRRFDAEPLVTAAAALAPDEPKVIEQQARLQLDDNPTRGAEFLRGRLAGFEAPPRNLVLLLAHAEFATEGNPGITRVSQWVSSHPDDTEARLLLSTWQIARQDWPAARENLRLLSEAQPANWVARNNHAWVLMKSGDLQAALDEVTDARLHGGDRAEILDTEGQIRLTRGEAAEAEILFRRAAAENAKPGFRINLAEALVVQNKTEEAKQILSDLLKAEDFAGKEYARELLARLGG
ncbi:XrtA/PEP-CTERM system TPR-repeat protein PrsT [Caenispirillum bisanense]|uniref:XrtA/PEP-CTERM system TPR-repeat protein PrsT n=1 Tax=Caenispirillum bisanense TaxID=414052 RepID=UPI0031D80063